MSDPCDVVVERVALGEPLGDLAEHAASCERCRRVAALPIELGAARSEADPGLGFAARMTAGAQHRLVVRKRRRIAAGLAAAVAVTTLGFFVVTREPDSAQLAQPATETRDNTESVVADEDSEDQTDEELRALVQLADTDRSRGLSAPWRQIEAPLRPYRAVVKGVMP